MYFRSSHFRVNIQNILCTSKCFSGENNELSEWGPHSKKYKQAAIKKKLLKEGRKWTNSNVKLPKCFPNLVCYSNMDFKTQKKSIFELIDISGPRPATMSRLDVGFPPGSQEQVKKSTCQRPAVLYVQSWVRIRARGTAQAILKHLVGTEWIQHSQSQPNTWGKRKK